MYWPKLSHQQIKERIFSALEQNLDYDQVPILGVPGTYLDREVFYPDAPFLKNAPYLSTLIANPNHIGCHTLEDNAPIALFKGTALIEKELIGLCAEQIFGGKPNEQDGYVATGGTEANIEALWICRNYFMQEHDADLAEISVVYSQDAHYSMPKGANLLGLSSLVIPVDLDNRKLLLDRMREQIKEAKASGKRCFIVVANLSTTMFGSVDPLEEMVQVLEEEQILFKIHVDAAFGGFIYPFVSSDTTYSFKNLHINSFAIDGHKMLQTPYGTGIFLVRKGFMDFVKTEEARYIPGKDYTLCGSRSGANALSIWMIMMTHGSEGWKYKMQHLIDRTEQLCAALDGLAITYYRNPFLNIVSIKADQIDAFVAEKYHLVPDRHEAAPQWWKVVVMPHVKQGFLDAFIAELKH